MGLNRIYVLINDALPLAKMQLSYQPLPTFHTVLHRQAYTRTFTRASTQTRTQTRVCALTRSKRHFPGALGRARVFGLWELVADRNSEGFCFLFFKGD